VATSGSVVVEKLMEIERYSHLNYSLQLSCYCCCCCCGKVATSGSVVFDKLMEIERYSQSNMRYNTPATAATAAAARRWQRQAAWWLRS
jgi:hypothetical protein